MKKKVLWIICALLAAAVALGSLHAVLGGAENTWSRRLCRAIRDGDTPAALAMMDAGKERGYSMDALTLPRSFVNTLCEQTITTPLETALQARDVELAQALLERGACPNQFGTTSIGGTGNNGAPVWYAFGAWYAPTDIPMLQLLLDYGADFSAEVWGEPHIIRAARRSAKNSHLPEGENTPENAAMGVTEVFRFVAQYTDVHVVYAGRSALHIAAMYENWLLCRALVEEYGIDTSLKMADGRTAYDIALENGAPEELLTLMKSDAR